MATTLLEASLQRVEESETRTLQPVTRMAIVGKLAPAAPAEGFGVWCDAQLKDAPLTGCLLLLPTGWVQMIEGPSTAVVPFLNALLAQTAGGLLASAKVIYAAEDVADRAFPTFCYKELSVLRGNYTEVGNAAAVASLLADTAIGAPPARCDPPPALPLARPRRRPLASRGPAAELPPHRAAACRAQG